MYFEPNFSALYKKNLSLTLIWTNRSKDIEGNVFLQFKRIFHMEILLENMDFVISRGLLLTLIIWLN